MSFSFIKILLFGNKLFSSAVREITLCYQKREGSRSQWGAPPGTGAGRQREQAGASTACLSLRGLQNGLPERRVVQCKRARVSDYRAGAGYVDWVVAVSAFLGQPGARCVHSEGVAGWGAGCRRRPRAPRHQLGGGALSLSSGQRMACGPEQPAPTSPLWVGGLGPGGGLVGGAGRRAPGTAGSGPRRDSSKMAEVRVGLPGL